MFRGQELPGIDSGHLESACLDLVLRKWPYEIVKGLDDRIADLHATGDLRQAVAFRADSGRFDIQKN